MAFLPSINTGSHRGAAVVNLNFRRSAAGVNGVGHLDQVGDGGGIVQAHLHGVAAAGGQVHNHVAHADQGHPVDRP